MNTNTSPAPERAGCRPGWRNCEIAEQFGQPCHYRGHDLRTDAQKMDDAHDEAIEMEAR